MAKLMAKMATKNFNWLSRKHLLNNLAKIRMKEFYKIKDIRIQDGDDRKKAFIAYVLVRY